MLWEFNKNTTETENEISSIYGQGVIFNCQVWNWFLRFLFADTSFKEEPRPGCSSYLDLLEHWWNTILAEVIDNLELTSAHPIPQSAATWKR